MLLVRERGRTEGEVRPVCCARSGRTVRAEVSRVGDHQGARQLHPCLPEFFAGLPDRGVVHAAVRSSSTWVAKPTSATSRTVAFTQ